MRFELQLMQLLLLRMANGAILNALSPTTDSNRVRGELFSKLPGKGYGTTAPVVSAAQLDCRWTLKQSRSLQTR